MNSYLIKSSLNYQNVDRDSCVMWYMKRESLNDINNINNMNDNLKIDKNMCLYSYVSTLVINSCKIYTTIIAYID